MVANKFEIERTLHEEKRDIAAGKIKEDNPLDTTEDFRVFCEACRRGDLKVCQEKISEGVNINARDRYDYTPVILASLCGHFEVLQLLLESGALCERDTFQGERALYNALNDRIRDLLTSYDFSKSTDPLQPLAGHITSLLLPKEDWPDTSDITLHTYDASFPLHKFILASRSPYFATKLAAAPETKSWKLAQTIPTQSFETAIRYLYMGEVRVNTGSGEEEQAILMGIDKLSKQLEIERLFTGLIEGGDRRQARQRRQAEINRGQGQLISWFKESVLRNKVEVNTANADNVRWDRDNAIFADVLLRADEDEEEEDETESQHEAPKVRNTEGPLNGIPIGIFGNGSHDTTPTKKPRRSVLFPAHKAMLLRSEFFRAMFASGMQEAQETPHLQIVPIDCSPEVLEVVLTFLYTEESKMSLELAVDVLFAADLLFLEKLKHRAAVIISTLGNGSTSVVESMNPRGEIETEDVVDIYEVIRAGWDTRVRRLEEFGARFLAYRLERFIDEPEFAEIVRESADRIKGRQETDTIELIDDIRANLKERFRLAMDDAGIDEMVNEQERLDTINEHERSLDDAQLPGKDVFSEDAIFEDEGVDVRSGQTPPDDVHVHPDSMLEHQEKLPTLDGGFARDEFQQDTMNHNYLLEKIDTILDNLRLEA